ncbi:MarR family transcriptional regulator [Alkaliphilus pronyensis]|uniref:MarR family transcriptional regulator n=1 Tax=Alkaliphilus pronyensis TaxID=1482732 RepID=A0A6I0FDC8_9FIRM|nr:MarR family transcriptional regulator [Alkaliphilus pronyensis]KAB3540970.1 MarR family transcriptional regulator [Alkaliphilus pronyensis]
MAEREIAHMIQDFFIYFNSWMRHQYKKHSSNQDFTLAQYKVLFIIKDLRVSNMSLLSDIAEVSKGTMTTMLNKLVEEEYVKRTSSFKDRRSIYVSLTDKGEKKVEEMHSKFMLSMIEIIESTSKEEKEKLLQGIIALNNLFKSKGSQ